LDFYIIFDVKRLNPLVYAVCKHYKFMYCSCIYAPIITKTTSLPFEINLLFKVDARFEARNSLITVTGYFYIKSHIALQILN